MKKKLIAILLVAALLVPVLSTQTSFAVSPPSINLYFANNEAYCNAEISGLGTIVVQLTLWHGPSEVMSWSRSGSKVLSLNETCDVVPGYSYTLKLNGTVGGIAFQEVSVTRTNYEMNK